MGSTVAKGALAVVTLVLMASMGGGFLLLPLLVPFHLWAARTSGSIGRIVWSLLPGVTAGMVVWAAVYVSVGEAKPFIWLVPMLAAAVAVIAALHASGGSRAAKHT